MIPVPITGIGAAPVKVAHEPSDHDFEPLREAARLAEQRDLLLAGHRIRGTRCAHGYEDRKKEAGSFFHDP